MPLRIKPFKKHKQLTDWAEAAGVDVIQVDFDDKNLIWYLMYWSLNADDPGVGIVGPHGRMVRSRSNRSWWTAGGGDAIPADPTNPGAINNGLNPGDGREYRIGGNGGVPNQFQYVDVYIHGTWAGTEQVKVLAVTVDDLPEEIAAASADQWTSHRDARMYKLFRLETSGLAPTTDLVVDITTY